MDDCRFLRPYLESLSTRELAALADKSGIDIPPGLERIFIIGELLDLENEEEPQPEEDGAAPPAKAEYLEPVSLPKQYNITYIEVLPRDPLWVFTFWEIKSHDKDIHERAGDFGGYFLKVIPLGKSGGDNSFTVSVEPEDTAWYLGFPPGGGCFRVDLCVLRGDEELVLAASSPFRLPKLLDSPRRGFAGQAGEETPAAAGEGRQKQGGPGRLAALSGLDDLPVLRNSDRLSRLPCSGVL
jgi:hypothetical protein